MARISLIHRTQDTCGSQNDAALLHLEECQSQHFKSRMKNQMYFSIICQSNENIIRLF